MENIGQIDYIEKTADEVAREKNDAKSFIRLMMQNCAAMGANDSEIPDLQRLEQQVDNDEIDPELAKITAKQIFESKQDYH